MRKLAPGRLASAFVALGASWFAPAAHAQGKDAAAADPPGLDFLEYLGSWQADDKEWYEIAEWDKENRGDQADAGKPAKPRQGSKPGGDKGKSGGERSKPPENAPQTEERQ